MQRTGRSTVAPKPKAVASGDRDVDMPIQVASGPACCTRNHKEWNNKLNLNFLLIALDSLCC